MDNELFVLLTTSRVIYLFSTAKGELLNNQFIININSLSTEKKTF